MNGSVEYLKAEAEFVCLLNDEIEKFNTFFIEKGEDFIIKQKAIEIPPFSFFAFIYRSKSGI